MSSPAGVNAGGDVVELLTEFGQITPLDPKHIV